MRPITSGCTVRRAWSTLLRDSRLDDLSVARGRTATGGGTGIDSTTGDACGVGAASDADGACSGSVDIASSSGPLNGVAGSTGRNTSATWPRSSSGARCTPLLRKCSCASRPAWRLTSPAGAPAFSISRRRGATAACNEAAAAARRASLSRDDAAAGVRGSPGLRRPIRSSGSAETAASSGFLLRRPNITGCPWGAARSGPAGRPSSWPYRGPRWRANRGAPPAAAAPSRCRCRARPPGSACRN